MHSKTFKISIVFFLSKFLYIKGNAPRSNSSLPNNVTAVPRSMEIFGNILLVKKIRIAENSLPKKFRKRVKKN